MHQKHDTKDGIAPQPVYLSTREQLSCDMSRRKGQKTCIASESTEPQLDDEAEPVLVSADVSMLDVSASSEQPSASRDGKHRSSGFNPKWLADPKFSRWHILGLYTIAQVLRWGQAKVNNK